MTDQGRLEEYARDIKDNVLEIMQVLQEKEDLADQVEEQQKGIEQLNNFIQFQRDILDETKMELKGAKEDYSRLLQTAEEITEQHRQEIERLKKEHQLQKEAVAGWARQYQQLQEQMDNALEETARLQKENERLKTDRTLAYHDGYKQGQFDEKMSDVQK